MTTQRAQAERAAERSPTFAEVYDQGPDYVYRTLRRMGVPEANCPDAMHEVFVVVHRRLPDYDPQRRLKGWLARISANIAAKPSATGEDPRPSIQVAPRRVALPAALAAWARCHRMGDGARGSRPLVILFLDGPTIERLTSGRQVRVEGAAYGLAGPDVGSNVSCQAKSAADLVEVLDRLLGALARTR
jgi:hypothetical protein